LIIPVTLPSNPSLLKGRLGGADFLPLVKGDGGILPLAVLKILLGEPPPINRAATNLPPSHLIPVLVRWGHWSKLS
jgi:hypothetical protein